MEDTDMKNRDQLSKCRLLLLLFAYEFWSEP